VLLAERNPVTLKVFLWYEDPIPTHLTARTKPYRIYGKQGEEEFYFFYDQSTNWTTPCP
jgi:hypothetical protein